MAVRIRARWRLQKALVAALTRYPIGRALDPKDLARPLRRIVVVTGMHRSGTTITGKLLDFSPRTFVVHEPFNVDWGLSGIDRRYPYLTAADVDSENARILRRFLSEGTGIWRGHGRPLRPTHQRQVELAHRARVLRPLGHTAIIKDPFMLLSLGWINRGLSDRPPVVTMRHPCAWVSSLQRRNMHPRSALASFREQDGFGDPVVKDILGRADWERADLVDAGAATWACLTRMLDVQLAAGARAEVVRMEDFSTDPEATLRRVYSRCRLRVPANVHAIVEEYTGAQNVVIPEGGVLHELRRNGAALAEAWRTRMQRAEQHRVRELTEPHAARWYDTW